MKMPNKKTHIAEQTCFQSGNCLIIFMYKQGIMIISLKTKKCNQNSLISEQANSYKNKTVIFLELKSVYTKISIIENLSFGQRTFVDHFSMLGTKKKTLLSKVFNVSLNSQCQWSMLDHHYKSITITCRKLSNQHWTSKNHLKTSFSHKKLLFLLLNIYNCTLNRRNENKLFL